MSPGSQPSDPGTGGTSSTPPTGSGYVDWTTLNPTGSLSFRQVLAAVPSGKILTLPAGTYTIGANFVDPLGYKAGVVIPSNCAGIWGSGSAQTILQLQPNSSTQASYVAGLADFDTNECCLIEANHSNITLKNFQLRGTPQGHYYNGLRVGNGDVSPQTGCVVDGVLFYGAGPGNKNYPPGETFSLVANHTSGLQILNCEVDGRDPSTGSRIGASGIGMNTSTNSVVNNTSTHHSLCGHGIAYWRCTSGTSTGLVSEHNGTGASDPTAGNQVNMEQSAGTWTFTNLTTTADRATGNGGFHMSIMSSDGSAPSGASITVNGVTNDAGIFWITIPDWGLSDELQLALPTIVKNGTTLNMVRSGGNATTNYRLST